MKKAIFTIVLLSGLLLSVTGFTSEKPINAASAFVQSQITDWVEYVYIGTQLYKITHHDDGSETIQAIFVND